MPTSDETPTAPAPPTETPARKGRPPRRPSTPDDELLAEAARASKRKKVGRKIGYQTESTRNKLATIRRTALVQDLMNLHSSVMHTIQIMIDRISGIEARFAALAENYAELPGKVAELHELALQTNAAVMDLKAAPKPEPAPEPAPAAAVTPTRPARLTAEQVCVKLCVEQGIAVTDEDGPALVRLFDLEMAKLPEDSSPPDRVLAFIGAVVAAVQDQNTAPRDWDFDFIS